MIGLEETASFSGATFDAEQDTSRLATQLDEIFQVMCDGVWRTLDEIEAATSHPPASISAQLRNLRKERFGNYVVDRRVRGERSRGLYEYRIGGEKNPDRNSKKDQPLVCYVERDQLVIRIGVDTLAFAYKERRDFEAEDAGRLTTKITNALGFAQDVAHELTDENELGATALTGLLDDAIDRAIENGSEFVEWGESN